MRTASICALVAVLTCVCGLGVSQDCLEPVLPRGVALVASPVTSLDEHNQTRRHPQVYWWGLEYMGYIGLWAHDPATNLSDPIERHAHKSVKEGYHTFSFPFDANLLPDNVTDVREGACLPLWVGYVLEGHAVHVDCLRIHPKWMESLKSEGIGELPLWRVTMPGSHDAGSTYAYSNLTKQDAEVNWGFTHHNSLYHQLVAGIRYLDMRIHYYPNTPEKYYISHNFVQVCPLKLGLEDVARFMSETKEIVVFDIHQLLKFSTPEALPGLKTLLQSYFSKWMVPKSSPNTTIGDLWESDKRLIVTLPVDGDAQYWPLVRHFYPDTGTLIELFSYFDKVLPEQAGSASLWSMNAEFTPSFEDILRNKWDGLSGAANVTNFPVSRTFGTSWWQQQPNIVAMDYGWGSDVIDVAIDTTRFYLCTHKPNDTTETKLNNAA